MTLDSTLAVERRAGELYTSYQRDIYKSTDRLFAGLMGFQWIAGIVFALWVSPLAWSGSVSRTHVHVWAAIVVGGIISLFPALLGLFRPGRPSTRYTIAVAQMLMGALLIHLTGGRLETHFHVFGSLAFLAFYRDWRVLVPATIVVALDHMLRGAFWPQSVYGVLVASQWRWLEHAAWVIFEDVFLVVSCLRSVKEMRETAERTATLEQEIRTRQQAETDAKNAWARNDGILDVALDCVILMDESGRIVQFNPAAERTFGYTAAEAVGKPLAEFIVSEDHVRSDAEGLARYFTSAPTAVLNRRLELSAIRKGGEIFPVEVAIAPISSEGSAMFAGYMRDITERRQAEAALAERMSLASLTAAVGLALTQGTDSRAMLEQCAGALAQHLDGGLVRIWTLNEHEPMLELQAGAGAHAALDGALQRVPVGDFTIGAIAAERRRQLDIAANVDPQIGDPDWVQRERMVAFAGYPLLLDGKLLGVMAIYARRRFSRSALEAMAVVADGIALGIERKRSERELARYTRDLEQAHKTERQNAEQLAKLVDQLRVTQGQAEAATRAKSDFLASMSHELRTPLNAIILYSELLQEEAGDQDRQGSVADLQKIQSAGKHLLDLINGILDLSKIEAGKMTLSLERFDIGAMIDDLLDTVGPLVEQRNNVLTVRCGDDVGSMVADFMKTRQILLNLLSNAGKFTRDGAISLDVQRVTVGGRALVRFSVIDSGVGMTPQQTEKVFDAFTQADVTTTRKYGGTGLGLAIVSRFCQLMGGSVSVESRPGEGSTFVVQLPLEVIDESVELSKAAGVAGLA
ncbi:MAG TPA: ATP-binding protein [Vicinamibacterales bacterium]|nr:ATP-binding protein [Vicinamibacterales bacterium]